MLWNKCFFQHLRNKFFYFGWNEMEYLITLYCVFLNVPFFKALLKNKQSKTLKTERQRKPYTFLLQAKMTNDCLMLVQNSHHFLEL